MYLKELTNEEFSSFTDYFIQSSIYQTTEYAFVMNKQGFDSVFLGLVDDSERIIAATLVLIHKKFGFKYAYAPRGFLLDYTNYPLLEAFTMAIKKYLGKKDIIAIKLCPMLVKSVYNADSVLIGNNRNFETFMANFKKLGYYHLGFNNNFESLKPRFEAILDLDKPPYDLFKHFKRGLKNKIRGTSKIGMEIYKGNKEDLEHLYLETKDNYPRNLGYFDDIYYFFGKSDRVEFYYTKLNTEKFLTISKSDYEKLENFNNALNSVILSRNIKEKDKFINQKLRADLRFETFKKRLVQATNYLRDDPNGIITATALILKYRDTVYLFMDGYDKKYREFNSKHLLLWTLIEKYSKLGFKHFNLGGMSNINLKENEFMGLNTFKQNFNPKVYEYLGDFELITNQGLYFMYKNAAPLRNIFKR